MGNDENDAKELPNSCVKSLDDHTKFLCGIEFFSRNFLDSATGGTFMEITLGEATKLLDNIMVNYSQWHTKRAPTSKKVNLVEEISSLTEKDDALVKLKFFPFSLRDHAKIWFSSLPKNSIDLWNKCKDAFISKYSPPAKIISLRTQIMNFKQLEHEHVSQSWDG